MQTVTELGEDALVERLTSLLAPCEHPRVIAAAGDDCAVTTSRHGEEFYDLLKVDCVVEGVHFLPETAPDRVGWKALCRAISDIAAMGGTPEFALISLFLSKHTKVETVEGWYRGLQRAAECYGVAIVGGETAAQAAGAEGAALSISLTGRVRREHCILRSGARPGDLIGVTGKLGGSFKSGRHLDFSPRLETAQWLVENASPTAMMDLSDGLSKDLPRLARSSGIAYEINLGALPCHDGSAIKQALNDGEDYELLVTVPERVDQLPLTIIGRCLPLDDPSATPLEGGWDHFRE